MKHHPVLAGLGYNDELAAIAPKGNSSMDPRDTLIDAIGNTPLIQLRKASEQTGCTILGKAEFMNPGGSVKDRAAKYIILDAEARGELEPGGVIVE